MNWLRELFSFLKSTRFLWTGSLVFNAPAKHADAMLFRWRGLSVGGFFVGLVISNHVTVSKPAQKRIILH